MMEKEKNDYAAILRKKAKDPNPSQEIIIEGVGTGKVYGVWDVEKIIKKLLEYEEFTG